MSAPSDSEIVLSDGPTTRDARIYHWFLDHLAKFPGRVTAVTFAAGVVVTLVVVLVGGDTSPTGVIGLVATLWALFFAVMIYLLTARDTDKVLDQIADLHEQLATALASPDDGDAEAAEASGRIEAEEADESAQEPAGAERPTAPTRDTAPDTTQADGRRRPARGERARPGTGAHPEPRILVGQPAIASGVPAQLLDAWTSTTGEKRDALTRAWTRDPRSDKQWVLETSDGERWVVFSRGARGAGVISLSAPDWGRGGFRRSARTR